MKMHNGVPVVGLTWKHIIQGDGFLMVSSEKPAVHMVELIA